ncbi:MAG: ABC transporter ATP-binding protein [Haloglomus sp.]
MPAILTVDDLSQSFGSTDVLEAVSFEVSAESTVAVVGPNGSGKTTLVRLLAGLALPASGTVTLNASGERPIGYLPQSPSFRPTGTVAETVGFYASLLDTEPDVESALDRVGLGDVHDRRVADLSGGMRRLLGLAVATLGRPELVVLDEPTSGLDPAMTDRLFEVLRRLREGGGTVLLATHRLAYVSDVTRLLVLNRGTIVADESPDALCDRTGTESLTAAFRAIVDKPGAQTGVAEPDSDSEPAPDPEPESDGAGTREADGAGTREAGDTATEEP